MQRKVAAIDGRGQGVCLEEAIPVLGPGEVKVRVEASLISPGSELGRVGAIRENPQPDRPPRPFGYSNAGVVEEVGTEVEQFEVGQGVACMGGGYALHADWACVPQNLCVAIPEGVSFVEAASVHLAATGLHAVRRTAPLYGGEKRDRGRVGLGRPVHGPIRPAKRLPCLGSRSLCTPSRHCPAGGHRGRRRSIRTGCSRAGRGVYPRVWHGFRRHCPLAARGQRCLGNHLSEPKASAGHPSHGAHCPRGGERR